MKKTFITILGAAALLTGGLMYPGWSTAGVNFNIVLPFPAVVLNAPPALVVVPGTYAYYAPDVEADLFFYRGYWYRPYRGEWYYSMEFNGPWGRVAIGQVPPPLVNLPPGYRDAHPRYGRMPYDNVQRNWRRWEEERYWDNDGRRNEYAMPSHGHGMGRGMGRGDD